MNGPLWKPSEDAIRHSAMTRLMGLASRRGLERLDPEGLHEWSVAEREAFWDLVWEDCGVISQRKGERICVDRDLMPGARWFPDARLNFAENLLRRRDDGEALVFRGEDGERRVLSFGELRDSALSFSAALRSFGIVAGDRIAAYVPNVPEAVIAMLGAASVGAIWSSCSPDFGVEGVVDRFGQIGPRILVCSDGYRYGGKEFDRRERVREVLAQLPSVERTIVIPHLRAQPDLGGIRGAELFSALLESHEPAERFESLPFDHPLYILYSSGTTGIPKCIVHGAGGTLLQHLKEHRYHCDLRPGDKAFYFTTCGWMMWNWLVSALASEVCVVLFDGSPFHPGPSALWDLAEEEGLALFGTSAKYIDAVAKTGLEPREGRSFEALRIVCSTGSPLVAESYAWVYAHLKRDLLLASISGGTDIVSCFVLGHPLLPVWPGECQAPGLGMAVQVFDSTGEAVRGSPGELVCTAPFPSMPVAFWDDPDGARYRAAYFERFPGVWCHGDWVEWSEHGGLIIHGRSDATLNPGGVRIGSAEIYRQVEQIDAVLESIAVGQEWDGDTRIVLFVRLRPGIRLDDELKKAIRSRLRSHASPRHVPAVIVQVPDIPRTKSGKIAEIAVRHVIHGREVANRDALANPEALDHYQDLPELRKG